MDSNAANLMTSNYAANQFSAIYRMRHVEGFFPFSNVYNQKMYLREVFISILNKYKLFCFDIDFVQ